MQVRLEQRTQLLLSAPTNTGVGRSTRGVPLLLFQALALMNMSNRTGVHLSGLLRKMEGEKVLRAEGTFSEARGDRKPVLRTPLECRPSG